MEDTVKNLNELYKTCLEHYILTGQREHPSHLLAMLLLEEKENYKPLMVSEGEFYDHYKKQIDEKINQVIKDFKLTKEDIIQYIEENGVFYDDYEEEKIWFVFCDGFGAMHGEMMYRPNQTPEEMYARHFELPKFIKQQKTKKL